MWNSAPSARLRSSTSTAPAVRIVAASTNENGPNVETTSSSAATPATRCSKFSRRQVARMGMSERLGGAPPPATRGAKFSRRQGARMGMSERLASAIPGVRVVPVADLVLAGLPAEVDLAAVAQCREVDEPALEVAQHDVHRLQLAECPLQLEDRFRDNASRLAAAVRRRRLAERRAGVLVGELDTRAPQPLEPLGNPFQSRIRLIDGVVARVLGHLGGSSLRRRS